MKTGRILVLENESIDGAYIRNLLERIGFAVDWVRSGDALLSMLEGSHYEAVLLSSVFLNDQDGEFASRLLGSETHIIGVANYSLSAEQQRFKRAGINQCLTKPIYQRNLSEALGLTA